MEVQTDLDKLVKICHSNLKNSKECLKYLFKNRGLSKDIIKKNEIGFFPQNPTTLGRYLSEETLGRLNITNFAGGSDFSKYFYLVFPVVSEYGEVVGISGRTLLSEEERGVLGIPKYKNSSYKKANILYGLNNAKNSILETGNVFVLEGHFDYLSMDKNGLNNSVAICGTAFSQNHFLKLARYTDKITFILDSDDAGIRSMSRIYNKFINKGIKLRFLRVPDQYKDVDEYFFNKNHDRSSFFKDFKQIIPGTW